MPDEERTTETIMCANPDCRVGDTGRCVEGVAFDACPYYGRQPDEIEAKAELLDESGSEETVTLPGAGPLNRAEASGVLRSGHARVIAILGPSDSGKTSLIASLYDLFQEGPVAGVEFARSRTLHAFEQTCHDARAASRHSVPQINRTPIGKLGFYHIEVGGGLAGERLALLLADRAGEEYRAVADDVEVGAGFSEVVRADTLTVLVDGERLLDSGARHNVRSDVIMVIQGLHDGDRLRTGLRLALVLTKIDVVKGAKRERVLRDFATLLQDLHRLFGHVLAEIKPFQVAASPKTDVVVRGTGVPELLTFWLRARESLQRGVPERPRFERAFARLRPHVEPKEEEHA